MYSDALGLENWDKRFYGIYRGVVVDANDPDAKGRIRMQVPQILGNAVTNWAWPVVGMPVHQKLPYLSVIDNTNQPTGAPGVGTPINTAMAKSLSTTVESYGITVVDDSKITFKYTGVYNIQFSTQYISSNSSLQKLQIWLSKNGVAVPDSASQISIAGNGAAAVPSWNFVISVKAGDYVQLYWATDSSNVYISSNPVAIDGAPHIPGVIVTATLAGGYTPEPGDGCWVQFEGGDPNFPLWIGAF